MSSPYLEKFDAAPGNREAAYAELYDAFHIDDREVNKLPSKRRRRRIALYQSIIGKGHTQILEIGCGLGDLTLGLAGNSNRVIGVDVSAKVIEIAKKRAEKLRLQEAGEVEFHRMGATDIKYDGESFDWVISTSMIEHLHPDDIQPHLVEVFRVLRKGGRYLVWAPNGLGHHGDRDMHLSMLSHSDLVAEMKRAGFRSFETTLFNSPKLIHVRWKIFLENWFSALGVKWFWSHLGIRNLLLVAEK